MQTKLSFLLGGTTQAVAWKRLPARGRIGVYSCNVLAWISHKPLARSAWVAAAAKRD